MFASNRAATVTAVLLIGLGILFLAINLLGLDFSRIWPIIFLIIAAGFYLPVFFAPVAREGLAALFIPGTIMLGLGLIFFYNTLFDDWGSWAYIWTLIPASVGVGLVLAAKAGGWGSGVTSVGLWMALISVAVFGLLAMLFGSRVFGTLGPIILIGAGVLLLIRSFQRSPGA